MLKVGDVILCSKDKPYVITGWDEEMYFLIDQDGLGKRFWRSYCEERPLVTNLPGIATALQCLNNLEGVKLK